MIGVQQTAGIVTQNIMPTIKWFMRNSGIEIAQKCR